jgi:Tfp pilus assembly protein PilF
LRVQTSFYLPRKFLDEGDTARAILMLSVAATIDPSDPRISYDLAAAHARAGEPASALRDLRRAVDQGFRRFEALDADPDFDSLRKDPAFREWLDKARI